MVRWLSLFGLVTVLNGLPLLAYASGKTNIEGYSIFKLGMTKEEFGSDSECASLFADGNEVVDGKSVMTFDARITPYTVKLVGNHELQIYTKKERFEVGDWSAPDVVCLCEVTFVDGVLGCARLVFDFNDPPLTSYDETGKAVYNISPNSYVLPELRHDYSGLVAKTLVDLYSTDLYDGGGPSEIGYGYYLHWADQQMDELNFSYVCSESIWLMTIRYSSPLYWSAIEGESDRNRDETESKL